MSFLTGYSDSEGIGRTVIPDVSGVPDADVCQQIVIGHDWGGVNTPPGWDPVVLRVWLILVLVTSAGDPGWLPYLMDYRDVPGYLSQFDPATLGDPVPGELTAVGVAQALKDAGGTVVLKEYADLTFSTTVSETDITLT